MIQIGSHPEVTPFHGLGELTGAQLMALLPSRKPVTARQLEIGRAGWSAFCSPEPSALRAFAEPSDAEMPFIQQAIKDLFQQFPAANRNLGMEPQRLTAPAHCAKRRWSV